MWTVGVISRSYVEADWIWRQGLLEHGIKYKEEEGEKEGLSKDQVEGRQGKTQSLKSHRYELPIQGYRSQSAVIEYYSSISIKSILAPCLFPFIQVRFSTSRVSLFLDNLYLFPASG